MKLLIVDDEKSLLFALSELFVNEGFDVITSGSAEEAITRLDNESIDIAILDYHLPGLNGLELLSVIKENYKWVQVILITAFGSENVAINAIKNGAYDYVSKPFDNEELLNRVNHIRDSILKKPSDFDSEYGYYFSSSMKAIIEKIKTTAKTDVPILITGESGTGKELIAKLCHYHSGRSGRFVSVNCSALPENLIESEMFGSEKGSFTGSVSRKIGYFELANNGSIFLDEIGEMPFDLQAKLLRVIQEGEVVRIGSGISVKINSRIISASNKNLQEEIKKNNFREDLFYRLNVIEIKVPSLKYRKEEISPLANMFLKEFNQKYKKNIIGFDQKLLKDLIEYHWQGNIRELKNKIEQAVVLCQTEWITYADINIESGSQNNKTEGRKPDDGQSYIEQDKADDTAVSKKAENKNDKMEFNISELPDKLTSAKRKLNDIFEKQFIIYYLQQNNWNVKVTADKIGLCRQDLYKKIRQLGIQKEIKYS